MRLIVGVIMLLASFAGFTKSYDQNCFGDHIRESIVINSTRKPIYEKLTNGRSNKIFNFLIASERLSLVPASYYDLKAREYQERGVPLYCYEFMSMTATPDFDPNNRVIPKEKFEVFDWKSYKKRLDVAIDRHDVDEIKRVSLEAVRALDAFPNYYCMLRHMFESIYRFAYFLPMQEEASIKAGLNSSAKLSMSMIKLQMLALVSSYKIDQWSAPIQQEGIPVLCSELPKLLDDLNLD